MIRVWSRDSLQTFALLRRVLSCVIMTAILVPELASAAEVVVPNRRATESATSSNAYPFGCTDFNQDGMRYQQVYLGTEVGSGVITQLAYRPGRGQLPFGPVTIPGVTITLSSTSNGPDALSTTFDANVGSDVKTVFSGDLTLSSAGNPVFPFPRPPFDIVIPLITVPTPFCFDASTGTHLLLDVRIPACLHLSGSQSNLFGFEADGVLGDSVSLVLSETGKLDDPTAIIIADSVGSVTQFTITPPSGGTPCGSPPPPPTTLVAAVLPSSRSVQVPTTATTFASVLNAGTNTAVGVGISLASAIPASFKYNATDCATNAVIGADNAPVNIPAVAPPANQACFVISITPTAPFDPTEVAFTFAGLNTPPVAQLVGINTLLMSASAGPVPDIVALAATTLKDGIVHAPAPFFVGAFAVATSNVGVSGLITVSANTGAAVLPVVLSLCETDPVGACKAPPAPSVSTFIPGKIDTGTPGTATYGVFVAATGPIASDAANNRVFVIFNDTGNVTRGRTSVAVDTP